MTYKSSLAFGFALTIASFALSAWESSQRVIPGAYSLPAAMVVMWLLLLVLPRVSPHGFRMERFLGVYGIVGAGAITALALLNAILLFQAAGRVLSPLGWIFVFTGMIMLFVGNYMGKLTKNFFIGIRTPWTLASDEVWARTHRLAGWLSMAAGLVIVIDGLMGAGRPGSVAFAIASLSIAVLVPFIYSYVLYRRLEGFAPDASETAGTREMSVYHRSLWVGVVVTLASLALAGWLYPHLPAQVPSGWAESGRVISYTPKAQLAFMMPAIMLLVLALLAVLPSMSPHGFRIEPFLGTYGTICVGLIAAFAYFNAIMLLAGAGYALPPIGMVFAGIGALLVVLGAYFGKLKKNFFVGVRTPWTLASGEVWIRTHRLSGWAFIVAGVAIVINGFVGQNAAIFIALVAASVLTPLVASFVYYWRIEGFGPDQSAPEEPELRSGPTNE